VAELRDLLRLLHAEHFLCLPCIALRLAIEPAEAIELVERLSDKIEVRDVRSTCPRCANSARLFTLGDGQSE